MCGEPRLGPRFGAETDPQEELQIHEKRKRRRPRGLPEKVNLLMSVYADFQSKMGAKMEARIA